MKTYTLIAVVLVAMFLLMGFGAANSLEPKIKVKRDAVSVSNFDESEDVSDLNRIIETSAEIDSEVPKESKESTFAQVSFGRGWAISSGSNQEGFMAKIFWVKKTFVKKNSTEETKVKGAVKIGNQLYKIVLDSETEDSMTFDLKTKSDKNVGVLEINADKSLEGFTVWSGEITINSGQTYEMHLATKNSKVKDISSYKNKDKDLDKPNGNGKKRGFFSKVKAFFKGDY